ncbi:FliI/YscN family ATPase [Stieleria varia]|uniref:Putative ATP synthase YscN n=1 Tax=Stieleria varia TaxID=2528005 RepID=A0A5C6AQF0_9BACT|nr:FliI/YscN family ATPase [Stieleria varia]TWU02175.1 putative ATP synthase YscN [Stieleria varia]
MIQTPPASQWIRTCGRLVSVEGRICARIDAGIGDLLQIESQGDRRVLAEVIGFSDDLVQVMPFEAGQHFRRNDLIVSTGSRMRFPVGMGMLGRVVNAFGMPIDGGPPLTGIPRTTMELKSPDPLTRPNIVEPFSTGIRAIDGMLTMGKGQRVGLFAGSGVGKSTLLGEIAKQAESDINVVALIGERGREVRPFIEQSLGPAGLAKSIVIVSTSDEPPLARIRASEAAIVIAGWFREQGKNVLLMLDSLTRLSHAQRELGLLLGEPPTSRGYTPSVFQKMAQLLEQLGASDKGTITGLLTVLVDGDDMNDPVADSARSILDGHIVLSRDLAHQNHYPAIDVLASVSRLFNEVTSKEHQNHVTNARKIMARFRDVNDLIQIGAYKRGIVPASDQAVEKIPAVNRFLQQPLNNASDFTTTIQQLSALNQFIGAVQ